MWNIKRFDINMWNICGIQKECEEIEQIKQELELIDKNTACC